MIATDASPDQIAHATPHPGVTYRVAPAEASGLDDATVDLVTAGQALHWFDRKKFFAEVERVGAQGGAVAVWAYDLFHVDGDVGTALLEFHSGVERYWPPERALVARRYADVAFPFEEIAMPPVAMSALWNLERMLGYLSTWSAVTRAAEETGVDPLAGFAPRLSTVWGDPAEEKIVTWPLVVRAGRIA